MSKSRESNIELLRILAALGVIVLHYNDSTGGAALTYVDRGSLNYYWLLLAESIFICAVDLFMIIAGYFMSTSTHRDLWKPVQLIAQVMVLGAVKYIVAQGLASQTYSIKEMAWSALPANYFVMLYIAVYLVSPYINLLFDKISDQHVDKFMMLIMLVFSFWPMASDILGEIVGYDIMGLNSISMYGTQKGFSVVNFILCYCVGAYVRRHKDKWHRLTVSRCLVALIFMIALTTLWAVAHDFIGKADWRSAWEYCNPAVICIAATAFLLFSKLQIGYSRVINVMAKGSFTVYLMHAFFLQYIDIESSAHKNTMYLVAHMIGSAIGIYLMCWCVYILYSRVERVVFHWLKARISLPSIDI